MNKQHHILTALLLFSWCTVVQASSHEMGEECKRLYDDAEWEAAVAPCTKAAEAGDVRAQSILGELYDRQGDVEKTRHWWRLAADAGYQEARNLLAQKYYYGGDVFGEQEGWEQDYTKAFNIWKPDADQGVVTSQFMVGLMYSNGQGVEKDMTQAWYWLKVAAENGYKLATDVLMEISRAITPEEKRRAEEMLEEYRRENAGKSESI